MLRVRQAPKPSPGQALRLHFSIVLYLHQTIDSEEALIESRVRPVPPKTVHTHLPRSFLFPPMTLESFSPAMPLPAPEPLRHNIPLMESVRLKYRYSQQLPRRRTPQAVIE